MPRNFITVGSTATSPGRSGRTAIVDGSGGALPGVSVELRGAAGSPLVTVSDAKGTFAFDRVPAGRYEASFLLLNFAGTRRNVDVPSFGTVRVDAVNALGRSATK